MFSTVATTPPPVGCSIYLEAEIDNQLLPDRGRDQRPFLNFEWIRSLSLQLSDGSAVRALGGFRGNVFRMLVRLLLFGQVGRNIVKRPFERLPVRSVVRAITQREQFRVHGQIGEIVHSAWSVRLGSPLVK